MSENKSLAGHTEQAEADALHWTAMADVVEAKGAVEYVAWMPFKRILYQPVPIWSGVDDYYLKQPEFMTWVPGWNHEYDGGEDSRPVWDGEGLEVRLVVSVHKPGRFPPRVFYTRQWQDPDGQQFGKPGLRMTTHQAFALWRSGERRKRLRNERGILNSSAKPAEPGSTV